MKTIATALIALLSGAAAIAASAPTPAPPEGASLEEYVREGVRIRFEARPVQGAGPLVEGQQAEIRFRVSDAASGEPITGLGPGAWLDLARPAGESGAAIRECKDKIGLYLSGTVGVRPMLDLNGYYLLVMNRDASIAVIDPVVSLAGVTSTFKVIMLKRAPMDWTRGADDKRLFVSMPSAGAVAVIDTERFEVLRNLDAGHQPTRTALQPDGRLLWIGNNSHEEARSGVTVIDADTLEKRAFLATGRGHHEIAFSADSRHAFVSNRDSGTVTVIDVAEMKIVRQVEAGRPVSVAYGALAGAVYLADGESGAIRVIDAQTLELRARIETRPGLGPLRFTQDARFAIALNPFAGTASVIDAATDRLIHTLTVSSEPYQLTMTRAFAYIRGLSSERVTMINLSSLGEGRQPILQSFAAGELAPRAAGDLPLAESLAAARDDAAVFVVNPADNSTYFYMEGMNAPMASYPNRGFSARAATVVDRGMRELEPGVYGTRVRLPAAGRFDVALMLDRPQVLHCFAAQVEANPSLAASEERLRVAFDGLPAARAGAAGWPVRFRIERAGRPVSGASDVAVRYFRAPASPRSEAPAREIGEGVYEALLALPEAGAYYLHVGAPSLGMRFGAAGYTSLRVGAGEPPAVRRAATP